MINDNMFCFGEVFANLVSKKPDTYTRFETCIAWQVLGQKAAQKFNALSKHYF